MATSLVQLLHKAADLAHESYAAILGQGDSREALRLCESHIKSAKLGYQTYLKSHYDYPGSHYETLFWNRLDNILEEIEAYRNDGDGGWNRLIEISHTIRSIADIIAQREAARA